MVKLIVRVWKIFKPFHKVICVIIALQAVILALQFFQPYIYGKIVDSIFTNKSFYGTATLIGSALAVAMGESLMSYIKSAWSIKNFDVETTRSMCKLTAEKIFSLSPGQHRNEHSGLTTSVVTDGQYAMVDLINMGIEQALPITLALPISIIAIVMLSPAVGIVVILGLAIYATASVTTNRRFQPEVGKSRDLTQKARKRWVEIVENATLVILQSEQESSVKALDKLFETRNDFWKKLWSRYVMRRMFGNSFIVDIFLSLSLLTAAYLASHGSLRIGAVVTIMFWVQQAFGELSELNRMQRQLLDAQARAVKYFALLDTESDVPCSKNPISANNIRPEIVFEGVSFTYSDKRFIPRSKEDFEEDRFENHEALHEVNLSISEGEHVAFVGPSGAGKSTMILLLTRGVDPTHGKILVDGYDLRDLKIEEFRRRIGFVDQNIVLFDDTLRFNISFGLGEGRLLSDVELDRLARISRIDEFRSRLKKGWDTRIGENGVQLSGGERQRVAIARALAKNPILLIFDEATSHLDPENEENIKKEIDEVARGRTSIFIAHRLSTVRNADKIVVFERGKIVSIGTHNELLTRSDTYKRLVNRQTEKYI